MAVSPSALGKVVEVFERNFRDRGELGASVSIWWDGAEILSHGHGWCEREKLRLWTEQTMVPVYSATKVPAAASLLLALASRGLNEDTPVTEVWSKFPVPEARFYHLLSHQCGLAVLDHRASILEHADVVEAIEEQIPTWKIGDGHGYHPRTFGALLDEPVRRLTGLTLGGYWREAIAGPLGLDFWIGLPETEWPRVARLYPGKAGVDDLADAFYKQLTTSGTFTRRAFSSPRGLHAIHEMNEPLTVTRAVVIRPVPSQSAVSRRSTSSDPLILLPVPFTVSSTVSPFSNSSEAINSRSLQPFRTRSPHHSLPHL
jgi:CubicO group peptidase (beta-lactamase class C family)